MTPREDSRLADVRRQLARRSPLWCRFFAMIFERAIRQDFHAVRVSRRGAPPAASISRLVFYSNHPSWWDAAIYNVLGARLYPGRPGYAPIDADMLQKYRFMPRLGAFGVEQNSARGAARFLLAGREALTRPDALLFITAQGRFADTRERPIQLAPGLAHLIDRVPDAMLVPLALDYPFWDERKPELLVRFGPTIPAKDLIALGRDERAAHLGQHLVATMDALAAEAIHRDPAAFRVLVTGASGVGGVYDLWRRGRALVRGERFVAAHGHDAQRRDDQDLEDQSLEDQRRQAQGREVQARGAEAREARHREGAR